MTITQDHANLSGFEIKLFLYYMEELQAHAESIISRTQTNDLGLDGVIQALAELHDELKKHSETTA